MFGVVFCPRCPLRIVSFFVQKLHYKILHYKILHYKILHYEILHYKILHYKILHYKTVLHRGGCKYIAVHGFGGWSTEL